MSDEQSFLLVVGIVLCTLIGCMTFYKVTDLNHSCTNIEATQ